MQKLTSKNASALMREDAVPETTSGGQVPPFGASVCRTPSPGRRLHELDSIRGLASFSVILLHFHEIWMPDNPALIPRWERVILTLLRPFYSGAEAVILFFLLSGLVLSLPYLSGREQPYLKYLLRRVLRVYGPYLAAIALSILGFLHWHNHTYHGVWAKDQWNQPLEIHIVLQHIAFLGVYDWRRFDFVIWSLIQEMRISIIFPILVVIVLRLGSKRSILLGIALSVIALQVVPRAPDLSAQYSLGITIHYIAFFLVGIVMASQLNQIEHWWRSISTQVRVVVAISSLLAYVYSGSVATTLLRILSDGNLSTLNSILVVANWVSGAGAVGLMIVGLNAVNARKFLSVLPVRFLGRVSYSLYLVHPLVLLAITFTFANRVSAWIQFPIYIAAALLAAWLFNMAFEQPFTRLSRTV